MHQDRLEYAEQKMLFKEELFCIDQDTEIKKKLHASIAALAYRTKDRINGCGSAVLLSKNLVLTSASNIYSKQDGYVYLSFKLYIAASGIAQKYYEIQSWRYLKDFQTCLDSTRLQYDYALLKLKQEVTLPDSKNFLTVSLPCEICMANKKQHIVLDVYGYPKYKENYRPADKWASKLFLKQYGLSRKDKIITISSEKCKLQYAVSTEIGHGGCPIATEDSIIAIHVGSGRGESQFNIGRLFTAELIKNLIIWSKQMNGHPISIDQKNICPHLENNQLFKSNSLVKNAVVSAVNVQQEEKEMQIGPMQIKGVYFFEVADAVRKMSVYKRSRVSQLTLQITSKTDEMQTQREDDSGYARMHADVAIR